MNRSLVLALSLGALLLPATTAHAQEPLPAPPIAPVAAPESLPAPASPAETPAPATQAVASGDAAPARTIDAPAPPPVTPRSKGVELTAAIGVRGAGFPSAGFDPYATGDFLGQLSLAFGPTFLTVGKVSFAALGEWDIGTARSTARGDTSTLTVHRLAVALESRYQLASRLGLFVKVAPGAYHLRGTIDDPSAPRPLVSRSWTYSLDATGGAAFLFAAAGPRVAPKARFWLTGELGYAFSGASAMVFSPAEDADDPRHYGTVTLPEFKPSGPVGRLALAISF